MTWLEFKTSVEAKGVEDSYLIEIHDLYPDDKGLNIQLPGAGDGEADPWVKISGWYDANPPR